MLVAGAWNARVAKCATPQQWNARPSGFMSNSRARAAQKCTPTCIPLLRRRTFRDLRTPQVEYRV
eukprot:3251431-Lingulodinium_polyedra.AAC.1